MKHNIFPVCLTVLLVIVSATLVSSVAAQEPELDEFIFLPVVIKSPPSSSPQPAVTILPNHLLFESYSSLGIYGEVQNTGGANVSSVEVVANLFNSGGQLIDISYGGWAELSILPPGEKTCFSLWFDDYDNWAYFEYEPPNFYSPGYRPPLENMAIDENSTYDPDENRFRIIGFIRNDNDYQVKYVQAIATLYNASGTVIGCGSTSVSSDDLDPGQSSSFELNFGGTIIDYASVVSYRMQVDGWSQ